MADTDAFVPDAEFVSKNIFFLVLFVGILILIIFAVRSFLYAGDRNYGPLKHEYHRKMVTDGIGHEPVEDTALECPKDPTKYSYTFFLEISDFYCNRGSWKCIMIKGTEFMDSDQKIECVEETTRTPTTLNLVTCQDDKSRTDLVGTSFNSIYNSSPTGKELELKDKLKAPVKDSIRKLQVDLTSQADLFKRLDLVCRALELDTEDKRVGSDMLCDAASNCGLFLADSKPLKMSLGICRKFLDEHKTYCNNVYAVDKKVARASEESRIQHIKQLEDEGNQAEADKEKKYDDYDNICSADNYLKEYPELIPTNLDSLKENTLINLAEKNHLDVKHTTKKAVNLEGCYHTNGTKNINLSINKYTKDLVLPDKVQEANRFAEENGFEYFGIYNLNKAYLFTKEDLEKYADTRVANSDSTCQDRIGKNSNNIYVSKVVKPGQNIEEDCWQSVINKYSYQNPGIWLHPFTNNIRIVLTTNSETDYQSFSVQYTHANKGNPSNYEVVKVEHDKATMHANVENAVEESINKCPQGRVPGKHHFFREYFDILNIPIMEEFHLAVVINGQTVEVYLNGNLNQTQRLFGIPTYNRMKLQISPGKEKLGGTVRQFKYFPNAITSKNIKVVIKDRKAKQSLGGESVQVPKDHGHHIEISHEHEFHPEEEGDHKHSVGENDIPKSYY